MRRAFAFTVLLFAAGACSGKGNSGRIEPSENDATCAAGTPEVQASDDCELWRLRRSIPWVNGYTPVVEGVSPHVPLMPEYPAIGQGTADPGSRVLFDTDEHRKEACRGLDGIQLSQWHHDFEPLPALTDAAGGVHLPGGIGVAQFFSAYDDHTEGAWHSPGDASWYDTYAGQRGFLQPFDLATGAAAEGKAGLPPWGLPADLIANGPSCDGTPNNWALHIKGGRFNYYGGGTEHPLSLDCNLGSQPEACAMLAQGKTFARGDLIGDGRADRVLDASAYTGIAFWARRGPDGATGLMVTLQDKNTSDRLERTDAGTKQSGLGTCQRIKQCFPTCADGSECVPMPETDPLITGDHPGVYRCIPKGIDVKAAGLAESLKQQLYPPCGQSACVSPGYDTDIDFDNTQCQPYNFTGLEENYWCFGTNPGDKPAAPDKRCGDGFVSNISLSTDWQFYKLPFSGFQQVGFAQKAPPDDVLAKTLFSIAFLFSVGNTDFYVDNITFYKSNE